MKLQQCKLLDLPRHFQQDMGALTFIENNIHSPFAIQRIYYLYDVPPNAQRGGHGHKELEQVLIAISGSFEILLDDGFSKKTFHLNSPSQGLYVCPMMWRELRNFSQGAVCLVLASAAYDEEDYYREYDQFIAATQGG